VDIDEEDLAAFHSLARRINRSRDDRRRGLDATSSEAKAIAEY